MSGLWTISENSFDPAQQHHHETIFTIGNGYLSTRGAFEEGYPGDNRATFVHGVFDAAPIVITELANAPDWLPLTLRLNDELFRLDRGALEEFERTLDLRTGLLTRALHWRSPGGNAARITFERFVSLANPHALIIRCRVFPGFKGTLEFRVALNSHVYNFGSQNEVLAHWQWLEQGMRDGSVFLHARTFTSKTDLAYAMRAELMHGEELGREFWDVEGMPTLFVRTEAVPDQEIVLDKKVAVFTAREVAPARIVDTVVQHVVNIPKWTRACMVNAAVWAKEWERSDVIIEGDDEAQIAMRFNIFQMLIAAPRQDERVSIGAKTLSGFGYRGHSFWDTEIFMLPLFTYTAPHIARNLLNYRYHNLAGARRKAQANGYEGAQFPWESAETGDEVTPRWVPLASDPMKLIRIWPGDIEIHISADIAFAAYQYWRVSGDDAWMIERGTELILDTAKFWASRAEWNANAGRYEYNDVIGPDENHDHVNNNFYTNRMAQWNLLTALEILVWLKTNAHLKANELLSNLDLSEPRLAHWRDVIEKIYLPSAPSGLIEQFEGFFKLRDVDLAALEPRTVSVQQLFGIEEANRVQVIKQPDVLMLLYLLHGRYAEHVVRVNEDYYAPRTDHTFGSSLGPSIQAIMACEVGQVDVAYDDFIRAVRADLRDVRGNAGDGIHAASAGGTWQSVVFGFAGLVVTPNGWSTRPRLPKHWKRLAFKFFHRGQAQQVDIVQ